MKLFLAVVFFCGNGQCYFWQSKDLSFDQESCLKIVAEVQKELEQKEVESQGTCLQINTRNNV